MLMPEKTNLMVDIAIGAEVVGKVCAIWGLAIKIRALALLLDLRVTHVPARSAYSR